jgi:hypothetical protein
MSPAKAGDFSLPARSGPARAVFTFYWQVAQKSNQKSRNFCATFHPKTLDFFLRLWYTMYAR